MGVRVGWPDLVGVWVPLLWASLARQYFLEEGKGKLPFASPCSIPYDIRGSRVPPFS